jgi:hypothetical protein
METLDRPAARTRPRVQLELVGFGLVIAGYVTMTLGILEIGGVFNLVLGLALTWVGTLVLFWGEGRQDRLDEAAFRRQLDAL